MSCYFEKRLPGIDKTFQFVNLPESSPLETGWEDIAARVCANETLMSWLDRLNGETCETFTDIYVLDPSYQLYTEDLKVYLERFEEMAGRYLNIYQMKGARAGAGLIWQNHCTAPILGVQSDNVILIDYEKILEINGSIGVTAVMSTILHECTHLIETYVADGDCLLGKLDPALAAKCEAELFFHPEEILALCPGAGPATTRYVQYGASYQQAEGQQREVLTSAVEMLTAAVLNMRDFGSDQGLKNAEALLSSHLEKGLAMIQSWNQLSAPLRRRGVDVSYWNGHLTKAHFARMKKQGVSFVIARAGGYAGTMADSTFENNYQQAKAAGLRFGAYYYGSAVTVEEAKKEARHALKLCKGKNLAYPIWYDVEDPSTMGKLGRSQLTKIIAAFCHTIKEAGHQAGVYASYSWLTSKIGDLSGIDVWIAQYNVSCSYHKPKVLWQYSSKKTFDGVSGHFDISVEMR